MHSKLLNHFFPLNSQSIQYPIKLRFYLRSQRSPHTTFATCKPCWLVETTCSEDVNILYAIVKFRYPSPEFGLQSAHSLYADTVKYCSLLTLAPTAHQHTEPETILCYCLLTLSRVLFHQQQQLAHVKLLRC